MKKYKVSAWPSGGRKTETIVSANDVFSAKRIAAGMFGCRENEVNATEVR